MNVCTAFPVSMAHSLMVLSVLADARKAPLGLKATVVTSAV